MRKPLSVAVVTFGAILCILVVAGRPWLGAAPADEELLVKNETASLHVLLESTESVGDRLLVTLRVVNNSSKPVVAYTVLKQDQTMLTTDGATTGWSLAPGDSDLVHLSVPSSDRALTVVAALFDDGSGEGDFKKVRELKDYRVAVKAQFKRVVPLLRQLDKSPPSMVEHLRNQILNLPEKHEDGNPSVGKSEGAKHAKQFILNQLKPNEGAPDQVQEYRSKVKKTLDMVEKAASKLSNLADLP